MNYGIEKYSVNELTVNEQNPKARGFYEHLGFKVYKRCEIDEQGNPYYYSVEEVVPSGYDVTYSNNDGIESGQISITNWKDETSTDYVLPETGGIGTNRFTAVGLALMAGSLMCGYVMRRKRRERRGN